MYLSRAGGTQWKKSVRGQNKAIEGLDRKTLLEPGVQS